MNETTIKQLHKAKKILLEEIPDISGKLIQSFEIEMRAFLSLDAYFLNDESFFRIEVIEKYKSLSAKEKVNEKIAKYRKKLKYKKPNISENLLSQFEEKAISFVNMWDAELLLNELVEKFVQIADADNVQLKPNPYAPPQTKEELEEELGVEIIMISDLEKSPNIFSHDCSSGARVIADKFGFPKVQEVKEEVLEGKNHKEIRKLFRDVDGKTVRFLDKNEHLIIAIKDCPVATFISQEMVDEKVKLIFELVKLPPLQHETTRDKEKQSQELLAER